jgi:hypothetical protein
MTDNKSLSFFSENVYSQFGEDGIIREILNRLRAHVELDSWCVEFGAWDGVFLSNTCRLIREDHFSAVLIEGDKQRADVLEVNFPQDEVHKICQFIHFEGPDSLEATLSRTPIPNNFDFLCIDVDGVDYHIFESIKRFSPKVVCIEFNPTIPNNVDFVQARDFSLKQGSSAKAIVRLAKEKSYSLVAATTCNLIFVSDHLRNFVVEEEQTIEFLNPAGNDGTYIFVGYDGTLLSNKENLEIVWHGLTVPLAEIQVLPGPLRAFPSDYGSLQHKAFQVFKRWLETYAPGGFWENEISKIIAKDPVARNKIHASLRASRTGRVRLPAQNFVAKLFRALGIPGAR